MMLSVFPPRWEALGSPWKSLGMSPKFIQLTFSNFILPFPIKWRGQSPGDGLVDKAPVVQAQRAELGPPEPMQMLGGG